MASVFGWALVLALGVTGAVSISFIVFSRPRQWTGIHGAAAGLCIIVSTVFLAGAIGTGKAVREVSALSQSVGQAGSLAGRVLRMYWPGEGVPATFDSLAASRMEAVRNALVRKSRAATVWATVVTVVLNFLLLLFLSSAPKASRPDGDPEWPDDDLVAGFDVDNI